MLPTGTVTFLMTDLEGSTGLVTRLGDDYEAAMLRQRALIRRAVTAAGGAEIDVHGDEVFSAFAHASAAAAAAREIQGAFAAEPWPGGAAVRVRIAIHTGEPKLFDSGYLGLDVHVVARLCSAGHGGQVLVSGATAELLAPDDTTDLGEHRLKGLERPLFVRQLRVDRAQAYFPALRVARDDDGLLDDREPQLAEAALAAVRAPRALARLRRSRRPGLADLGWAARHRRAGTPQHLREALTTTASTLLSAARPVAEADRLIAEIDRRALTRRLAEYRDLGVISKIAEREAAGVERQLALLDRVASERAALSQLEPDVAEALNGAEPRVDVLRTVEERVRGAATSLAATLTEAQQALGDSAGRLRRTATRGVFRLGDVYAVPFVDSTGVDRIRRFDARAEAKAFARNVRFHAAVAELPLLADRMGGSGGGAAQSGLGVGGGDAAG